MAQEDAAGDGEPKRFSRAAVGVGIVLCAISGFLFAAVSLFATGAAGVITIGLGLLLVRQRRPAGTVVVACGVALLLGACGYVLLGLLQPDGAPTGRG